MSMQEIRVPDIGDFKDIPVVEIFIKPGDRVELEAPLLSVESDKATMDIPSPLAGIIASVSISVGDDLNEGALIATIEVESKNSNTKSATDNAAPLTKQTNPEVIRDSESTPKTDVVIIGGGPGGYSAAFRAADLGLNVTLIDRDATLGGVCLNVGCIPSKALLHIAAIKEEAERLDAHGVSFGPPTLDLEKLRQYKTSVVNKLTNGLSYMANGRKVNVVRGTATFADANHLNITLENGESELIGFKQCIIAAGSAPVHLPFLPDDERIFDSTGALELPFVPQKMLVIGGGIIGLEMATIYSALGARIDVVEQFEGILTGVDRDLEKIWMGQNKHRFDRIMTSTKVTSVKADKTGLHATFEGNHDQPETYDFILQAAGRRPNGRFLNLDAAGLTHERGFITVNEKMQTNQNHIFAIGDIVGQPMLAHKAVHQGHVAAEVCAGHKVGFDTNIIPSVAYTDPEIAWVGLTENEAEKQDISVKVGRFPWAASGRAIANNADYGLTKLLFSRETGRVIGGAVVGPSAGDIIGEICLAIEMGADAVDIGKTIHPHPTLGESIGLAAEVSLGICTDMPPT